MSHIRFIAESPSPCVGHTELHGVHLRAERFCLSFQTQVCVMPFSCLQFHHKFGIQPVNLVVDCQIFCDKSSSCLQKFSAMQHTWQQLAANQHFEKACQLLAINIASWHSVKRALVDESNSFSETLITSNQTTRCHNRRGHNIKNGYLLQRANFWPICN